MDRRQKNSGSHSAWDYVEEKFTSCKMIMYYPCQGFDNSFQNTHLAHLLSNYCSHDKANAYLIIRKVAKKFVVL